MSRKTNTFENQIRRAAYHPRVGDFFWGKGYEQQRFARVIGVTRKHVHVYCRRMEYEPECVEMYTREQYARACRKSMVGIEGLGGCCFKLKGRR